MYIQIGTEQYTKISNLDFAPQTDITGAELAINTFSAVIITDDEIDTGVTVYLYDDMDTLWAAYWLTFAENIGRGQVQIKGESYLTLLDRIMLAPAMYSGKSAPTLIGELFTPLGSGAYSLDSSFSSATVTGYCPEQTARQRLQWVLFVIGAYAKTYFTDKVEILAVDDAETMIPLNRTFKRPKLNFDDYITAIKVKAYSYTQGTPATVDTWVQVGNDYYIQTEQTFTLSNPSAPATAPENVKEVDGLTLINTNNVSEILTLLSTYFFKRVNVDADVINNADYAPGEKVIVYATEDSLVTGYISVCRFSFGKQARSSIRIVQTDVTEGGSLIIKYMYGDQQIGIQSYLFPVGYQYQIENPYIDLTTGTRRRIYRPQVKYAEGTVTSEGITDEEQYDIALEFATSILRIYSVDQITQSEEGVVTIG